MEIGSFIELQFPKGREYYKGDKNIARLNSGRAAIYHAARVLGCDTVWLPYYQCDTVRDFLIRKHINVKYYHINSWLDPQGITQEENEATGAFLQSDQRLYECLFREKIRRRPRWRVCYRRKRGKVCG